MHKTMKKVTGDIERFHFNTAIAAVMEYINALYQIDVSKISEEEIKNLILMINPFAPHAAEELWREVGGEGDVYHHPWPTWNEELTKDDEILVVVQINGKLRDKLNVPADISENEAKKKVS